MRWMLGLSAVSIVGVFLLIITADHLVQKSAQGRTFNAASQTPQRSVGLLLGTGKHLKNGRLNLYYQYRIDAAISLYEQGKIEHLLISGDNSRVEYDEPTTMKNDLVALGIPAEKIHLDYAGFSTLDSVIRCQKIFGQSQVTIISQKFHNQRAIYLASHHGLSAVGFNAKDVSTRFGWKVQLRERLARVKALLDITRQAGPRYLGEQVAIR